MGKETSKSDDYSVGQVPVKRGLFIFYPFHICIIINDKGTTIPISTNLLRYADLGLA